MRVRALVIATAVALSAARSASADAGDAHTRRQRKMASAVAVIATYAAFSTYAYFAWFREPRQEGIGVTLEGFGADAYAGGADKLGHFWATYALTRATTSFLVAGGWPRLPSSIVSGGVWQIFFTLSEIEDSFIYQFEVSDIIANVAGSAFAVLMVNAPSVDRLIDVRLEYWPSPGYRRQFREEGDIDAAQDYTGQSYMLAVHLDAVPGIADTPWLRWASYVDVVAGFEARNYFPVPTDVTEHREQALYLGLAVNMQHVLGELFCASTGRRIGEGAFEVLSVPYTTLRVVEGSRSPGPR